MVWMLLNGMAKAYDQVIILSPSVTFDKTWRALDRIGHIQAASDCNEELLENILALQKQRYAQTTQGRKPLDALLVVDDFGPAIRGGVRKAMEKLYSTARHFGLSIWFTVQHAFMLTPVMRLNTKNVILFKLNYKELRKLSEEWQHHLSDKEFIDMALRATREKYSFLHINLQTNNRDEIFSIGFT
jgi:hypothetical protein